MFRLIEPVVDQAIITAVAVVTASYIIKIEGGLLLTYCSFTEEAISMVKERL